MNSNKKNHKDLEIQRWVKLEEFYSSYIITSVKLNDGSFHALSRYGDNIWYLPSSMFSAGISKGHRKINFSLVPVVFQEPLRQCLAIYILNGIEGRALPKGNTIQSFFFAIISFLTWLNSRNIKKLNEVTQLTTQQYVQYCKQKKNKNDEFISNYTLLEYFVAVENLHFLSKSLDYPLQHPWPNSSSNYLAGLTGQAAQESRTKIIPDGVLSLLFRSAINWLDQAEEIIEVRSKVESWKKNNRSQHYIQNNLNKEGWTLKKLRKAEQHIQAACICVVLITSGIRVSELLSLENNCAYKTMDENNEPFYWIKGITYKTGTKNCEWLVTRITHRAIAVAEKIALPIQKKLGEKIAELKLKSCNNYLAVDLEEHSKRIFLTVTMQHKNKIDTMSKGGVIHRLNEFASQCGIKWRLSPHQFRRTFAVYAAHSVFGDLRYLRDHFKHWSLDMTALYAMSQHQDAELYDSIGLTALNIKTDIIEHWLEPDEILVGIGAKSVRALRTSNHPLIIKQNRTEMLKTISPLVNIRATGVAWCTADTGGCSGGHGLEKTRCADCSHAIIDKSWKDVWQGIYAQQIEMLDLTDIGPGGEERVKLDLKRCEAVLKEFGLLDEGN
ncbi:tyrosine-type recombinase/integrase [Cobetia sp.]|mgnify:FL=1|uniref:tyrosine-type recombinase/integrase n=1 Tax=Cobetia sp. TaxID=1873876 RepID=UPI00257F2C9F|nr:tyrosine-type recombinase/integrase [Cobetia sp.]|tara:strand:+ start:359 stop:2191 length:1833 start_codon:yes stop_codon:yes gene_type:complete